LTAARARCALLLLPSALLLSTCGGHKESAVSRANVAVLAGAPVYPGASAPKTTTGDVFAARDWTLPAGTSAERVIDWYIAKLQARRWKVSGKSFNTIRATRGTSSLSVGVRGHTLELIGAA